MRIRPYPTCYGIVIIFLLLFSVNTDAGIWNDYSYIQNATCLHTDGNYIWIGSTAGVWQVKRDDETFIQYTTQHGLVNNVVMDIAIDEFNHKWFATLGGVSRFDGSTWTRFTTADGLPSNQVRALAIDSSGIKWFGTAQGIGRYDGSQWDVYTVENGLAGNLVNVIEIDMSGIVWIGTNSGVSRFDGVSWTTCTTANGLAHNKVNAIAADDSGNKWFGTDNGVSRYGGNAWITYRTGDGLAANLVNDITIDAAGHKWFACYGGGISEFYDDNWIRYTKADGLISNQVTAVTIDMDGHAWIGTGNGVSEFDSQTSMPDSDDASTEELSDGDMNNDGISDESQDNLGSLPLAGGETVTVISSEGTKITNLSIEDLPAGSAIPSDLDFPYGLIDFTIEDVGVGESAVVTLYFPEDSSPTTYYKYGPTPDQPQDHWYEFMFNGETGAKIDDNIVALHFVDGKRGDDVYTLDGKIVDIGGPGFSTTQTVSAPASTGSSGGEKTGGCFLNSL